MKTRLYNIDLPHLRMAAGSGKDNVDTWSFGFSKQMGCYFLRIVQL
ncbi:MAG TPA: hypothetical protein VFA77_10810 [Candidatus Eisenbacteria bacterium]|nr:hypothetical protein [Candidatus Eisenbacteria bacterium]